MRPKWCSIPRVSNATISPPTSVLPSMLIQLRGRSSTRWPSYRNAYLRWIDGTRRRPELRAERIAELVGLLEAGHKQRPRPGS
jgi:Bacteriocin-protection, YdeI or OmpD-Associated